MAIDPNVVATRHLDKKELGYIPVRFTNTIPPASVTSQITGEVLLDQTPRFEGELCIYQDSQQRLAREGTLYVVVNIGGTLTWKRMVFATHAGTGQAWNPYASYGNNPIPTPVRPAISVN